MAKRPGWIDDPPKGHITEKGTSGPLASLNQTSADQRVKTKALLDRMPPKSGEKIEGQIKGGKIKNRWVDPKTGAHHVLFDTTGIKVVGGKRTKLPKRSDPVEEDQKVLRQAIDDTDQRTNEEEESNKWVKAHLLQEYKKTMGKNPPEEEVRKMHEMVDRMSRERLRDK